MELQSKKQQVSVNEMAFEGQCEQPVECDIMLPDYCPDIQRILYCDVNCQIGDTRAEAQRLTIDGQLHINVLYVSDKGMLRGIDHKENFSRHLDSKHTLCQPMVEVQQKLDYVNCRAVNSRRLELRAALTLKVRAINCSKVELLADGEGAGVQLKKKSVEMDSCIAHKQSVFTLREELELGDKAAIGQILSSNVQVELKDHKILSGKIICKGELQLQLLYWPLSNDEKETPQQLNFNLPVSQIIYGESVEENSDCCIFLGVRSWELQPKADLDGEMKSLVLEALLQADVFVHDKQQLQLVQDAYSTVHPVKLEEKNLSFLNFVSCLNENHHLNEDLSKLKEVKRILSAWAKVKELQYNPVEDGLRISGRLALYLLYLDEEENPQIYEEIMDLEHLLPLSDSQRKLIFHLQLLPIITEASFNGASQPELNCQLQLRGSLYSMERESAVSDLAVEENSIKAKEKNCGLCIYYADEAESLWDIAKKYNSSVTAVMEENALEQEILSQETMLLIPMF